MAKFTMSENISELPLYKDTNTGLAGLIYILKVCYNLENSKIIETLEKLSFIKETSLVEQFLNDSYLNKIKDNFNREEVEVKAPQVVQEKKEKPVAAPAEVDFSSFF